jgi:GR25 family glycosyltransferase involved in LPS biosynthesis
MKVVTLADRIWTDLVETEERSADAADSEQWDGIYLAVPWADIVNGTSPGLTEVEQSVLCEASCGPTPVVTTFQHCHVEAFLKLAPSVRVSHVISPHCTAALVELYQRHGITLVPGVHSAVVSPDPESPLNERPVLASFRGMGNHPLRETVRQILNGAGCPSVCSANWGVDADRETKELYSSELASSFFVFCPPGMGEGSIRLTETVEHGAVPVLVGGDLLLPPLWENAVVRLDPNHSASWIETLDRIRREAGDSLQAAGEKVLQSEDGRVNFEALRTIFESIRRLKAVTMITPSHRGIWQRLRATLPLDVDLITFERAQQCPSGEFMEAGWNSSMIEKVECIAATLEELEEGDFLLHVDADIQFYGTYALPQLLEHSGEGWIFTGQSEVSADYVCGGFFLIVNGPLARRTLAGMLELMRRNPDGGGRALNDQEALNAVLRRDKVKYGCFPEWLVWSPRSPWRAGNPLDIPVDVLAHHANWTTGAENKIAQLREGAIRINRHLGQLACAPNAEPHAASDLIAVCLSLPRRPDRQFVFERTFPGIRNLPVEFFPAIDGYSVPMRKVLRLRKKLGIPELTQSNWAVRLSKCLILREFLQSNADLLLVFEDDCLLLPGFEDDLELILADFRTDIAVFSGSKNTKIYSIVKPRLRFAPADPSELCMLLNRAGAEKVLRMLKHPSRATTAEELRDAVRAGRLSACWTGRFTAVQRASVSDNGGRPSPIVPGKGMMAGPDDTWVLFSAVSPGDTVLEWGAGKSTELLAHAVGPKGHIYSFEHNFAYFTQVEQNLIDAGIASRVSLNYVPPFPLREDDDLGKLLPGQLVRYVQAPRSALRECSVDVAFVDGRQRVRCMDVALDLLRSGGLLIVHDFWGRSRYRDHISVILKRAELVCSTPQGGPDWAVSDMIVFRKSAPEEKTVL